MSLLRAVAHAHHRQRGRTHTFAAPSHVPAGAACVAIGLRVKTFGGSLRKVGTPPAVRALVVTLVFLTSACSSKPSWRDLNAAPSPSTKRQTSQGAVIGYADSPKTHAWSGVPYAAPPVGTLRWKAPRAPASWGDEPRLATRYGEVCPQFDGLLIGGRKGSEDVTGNEDCLTLNVSAPQFADPAGEKRAVMVWIHGGGNSIGTANTYGVMRNLAARFGVVVVSVNYRLGLLGWFHHPSLIEADATPEDASGNFGTLDLIAALKWVNQNIAGFGGDPGNVTVFGESAGGFNIFTLLASPLAKGLFARAAIESGVPSTTTLAEAENFTDSPSPGAAASSSELLLKYLMADGRASTRDAAKQVLAEMKATEVAGYLRAKSPAALLEVMRGAGMGMYRAPALFRDGAVLPVATIVEVLADPAQGNHVPVLLGTNRDEWKLFQAMNPKYVGKRFGLIPFIKDEAAYDRDAALVSDVWKMIGTDWPAQALTQSQGNAVFAYRFDWDEEPSRFGVNVSKLLGAAHGLEIAFVFDDTAGELDAFGAVSDENREGRSKLAQAMSSYWVNFAKTGMPGRGVNAALPEWKPYTGEQFMVFDSEAGGGLRMQSGAQQAEALETRVWADETSSVKERCRTHAKVFAGFSKGSGGWTAEREASFRRHCPGENAESLAAEP